MASRCFFLLVFSKLPLIFRRTAWQVLSEPTLVMQGSFFFYILNGMADQGPIFVKNPDYSLNSMIPIGLVSIGIQINDSFFRLRQKTHFFLFLMGELVAASTVQEPDR